MRAEILCVGSELLLGQIIDTNAPYIAGQLARVGVDLHRKQTAGDNLDRIADCICGSLQRAEVLVVTGGLGPTTDDLTREAIAQALGVELEYHEELAAELRAFFARRNYAISETTLRQAYLPQGAVAIPNPVGTAPGVRWEHKGQFIFAVPGVPREMRAMVDGSIVPALLENLEGERQIIVSRVLRAFGIGESALADPLEDILTTATNPTVAPLIYGNTEVHLRLTAKVRSDEEAQQLLDAMEERIRERVGDYIFGRDEETLPAVTLTALRDAGKTLALAESLTGGMLGTFLTDPPGFSQVLRGGVVAYHPDLKRDILEVPAPLIEEHTVVSAEVAKAMAEGMRHLASADFALATTGEAGPLSSTGKPVGTVFIALAHENGTIVVQRDISGDRDSVRRRSALNAVDLLRRHLADLV